MSKGICSVRGCGRPWKARGLCMNHYSQAKTAGTLPPLVPRRYYVVDENGCWIWQKAKTTKGYGYKYRDGRMVVAHRWMYELSVGPIPEGLQLDHLCRVHACINPAHLEPVTPRENNRRGIGRAAANARKTHCIRGHAFDEENTYLLPSGRGRACRECKRQQQRAAGKRDRRKLRT
jgi:hypothetical protein